MDLDTTPCFCFICGTKLEEIGLGWMQCNSEKCAEVFLPFKDLEGNQNLMMQKNINIKKSKKMEDKNKWIEVFSDHEISEYSKNLEPIWIILEEDEHKIPILAQPDGDDNYYGEDDCVYHYCDISHFMKIERPKFNDC